MRSRPRLSDDGFTLIELLVSALIMGVVIPALALAFLTVFKLTGSTEQQYEAAHDVQITSTYFSTDAASAAIVNPTTADIGASSDPCGSGAVVEFYWRGADSPTNVDHLAAYTLSGSSLRRLTCSKLSTSSVYSVDNTIPLGTDVTSASATCTGGSCATSSTPAKITLSVSRSGGAQYSAVGTRRAT